jgi:proteasome lid subunit RPN8/RPN11
MSDELAFGEIQFSQPELGCRPDRDPQYAVAEVGKPGDRQLPIFVDVETLRAVERSLGQDTSIELGGVLLGSQHIDDHGQPFVVVRESLEARHYEATKGSFKFTLDTWQDLLHRAARYPPPLKIIGWYHSHPGWGIFLSEMDLFICQGFFNNPLDVALVVDPCQDHRGWFYWQVDQDGPRKRQSLGFFLFDSRHRSAPLQRIAAALNEAEQAMSRSNLGSSSSRLGGRVFGQATDGEPGSLPTQVFISQPDTTWPWVAMMAMLGLQTILIALIAWSFLRPSPTQDRASEQVYENVLQNLIRTIDPAGTPAVTQQRLRDLVERQREIQELESANKLLTLAAEASQAQVQAVSKQLETSSSALQNANALNRDLEARVATLEAAASRSTNPDAPDANSAVAVGWTGSLISSLIGILGLAVGGIAGGWWISRRQQQTDAEMED